jgi:hypothetical protein
VEGWNGGEMYGPGRMGYWRGRMGPFGGPALLVIALVVGGLFLFSAAGPFLHFFPFFLFFWVIPFFVVPMLALAVRSVARLVEGWRPVDDGRKEKELLEALARHGELTPARAALETTLGVDEADRMLSGLAKDGHIEVRAREGRLGYALWEADRRELTD